MDAFSWPYEKIILFFFQFLLFLWCQVIFPSIKSLLRLKSSRKSIYRTTSWREIMEETPSVLIMLPCQSAIIRTIYLSMKRTRWIDEANLFKNSQESEAKSLVQSKSQITLSSSHYAKNVMHTVLCLASTSSWLICCLLPSIRPRSSSVFSPIAILQTIERRLQCQ